MRDPLINSIDPPIETEQTQEAIAVHIYTLFHTLERSKKKEILKNTIDYWLSIIDTRPNEKSLVKKKYTPDYKALVKKSFRLVKRLQQNNRKHHKITHYESNKISKAFYN